MGLVRRVRAKKRALALLIGTVLACGAAVAPALAFDFFGLFGGDTAPEPGATALPYELTFEAPGADGVEDALQQASNLYKLRRDAPPDGQTLVARAEADFAPLIDALWSQGYYNARVVITVAGQPLELGRDRQGPAARAANAYRGRERVPVRVVAEAGPLFRLRAIQVVDAATRLPFPPEVLPPRIVKLAPGDPARSADIRSAVARLSDWFRSQSYPLVKVPAPSPVVDHAALSMDVTFAVATGPLAGIGEVAVKGPQTFPQEIVRSFIYLEEGEPYTPKKLDDTRKSVAKIPAVGSVRVREGTGLDRNGNLPVFVDVTDRAPNLVGFQAGFSTLDGPTGRVFYENRNLFGGAERFRVEGAAFFAPRNDGSRIKGPEDLKFSDIGARLTVGFLKPALGGSHFDFTFDGVVERNRIGGPRFGGYTDRLGGGTAGLRYRVDESLFFTGGIKYERGQTSDVISQVDYQLVGTPLGVRFDNTDKPLDPSKGFRIGATITPYPKVFGSSLDLTRATAEASTYLALDEDANYILAGRIGLGALLDAPTDLRDIPSNYRFYTGGGGSVRGYRFQTIGPRGPFNFTVGGRSLFEGSLEARVKVTDTIGIVPFFDAGAAYSGAVPDFLRGDTRMSAGIGLRYYTGIGPIRLDVAVPINPRPGDQPVALYVSLGQSF